MLIDQIIKPNHDFVLNKISTLLQLYDSLSDTAKMVNQNYAVQLLPSIANQFGITLFAIFYCYWMVTCVNFLKQSF